MVKIVLAIVIYGCLYVSLPFLEALTSFWPESLKSPQVQFLLPIIFSVIPFFIKFSTTIITSFTVDENRRLVFKTSKGKDDVTTPEAWKQDFLLPLTEQIASLKKELDDRFASSSLTYTEKQQKVTELQKALARAKQQKKQLEVLLDELLQKLDGKDLSKADPLYQTAFTLFVHGRIDQALKVLDDSKLQSKEKAGADKQQLADLYLLKADLLKAKLAYAEAGECLEKVAELAPDSQRCFNTAKFYQDHNVAQKAKAWYEKALALAETQANRAKVLNNLALLQRDMHDYKSARNSLKEALVIFRDFLESNPDAYLPHVATALNNLAVLQKEMDEYELAKKGYADALSIRRELSESNPDVFLPSVAATLNNLGELQKKLHEYASAKKSLEESLSIYWESVKSNSEEYLPKVALTLSNLAIVQWKMHEYKSALQGFNKALGIYRDLLECNPAVYLPNVAETLNNFALLQKDMHDYKSARKGFEDALVIYRDLLESNPAVYLPYVAGTLNNLGILQFDLHDYGSARQGYEEALGIYRELAKHNPEAYLPYVAQMLYNLGVLYRDASFDKSTDKQRSLDYLAEALTITLPHGDKLPYKEYASEALKIVNSWDLDTEELAAFYRQVGMTKIGGSDSE